MEKNIIGIEKIKEILPEEWEEKARELGAFTRARGIKSPEELLVLILLYVTSIGSIGGTSSILRSSGTVLLNKNAVYERLLNSEEWLKWLNENISYSSGFLSKRPEWLAYKRVLAVDTTKESSPDAEKTMWNLHYLMDIFTLEAVEINLTDEETGEKMENFKKIGCGDIIVGDRMYGTIKSIEYTTSKGADYVFRLKTDAFNLYDEGGKLVDMKKKIRRMRESAYKQFHLYYKFHGELKPVHICIYRKNETEIKESSWDTSENAKFYGNYIVVATSLYESVEKILELYRLRWQIELLFKRLKSIFNLDELKAKTEKSIRVWFYSKLLLAAICETLDNMGRFSPSSEFSFAFGEQME